MVTLEVSIAGQRQGRIRANTGVRKEFGEVKGRTRRSIQSALRHRVPRHLQYRGKCPFVAFSRNRLSSCDKCKDLPLLRCYAASRSAPSRETYPAPRRSRPSFMQNKISGFPTNEGRNQHLLRIFQIYTPKTQTLISSKPLYFSSPRSTDHFNHHAYNTRGATLKQRHYHKCRERQSVRFLISRLAN